jgi:hypothetical protein
MKNGKFDKNNFIYITTFSTYNNRKVRKNVESVARDCDNIEETDACEESYKLLLCIKKSVKVNGFKPSDFY